MQLKPITCKKEYEKAISDLIIVWLWQNVFQTCFDILKQPAYNSADILQQAITSGQIYYEKNYFYARNGRFTNAISTELEKLGAVWSKTKRAYKLDKNDLPTDIKWSIGVAKAKTFAKAFAIKEHFSNILKNFDKIIAKLKFEDAVNSIMMNLQKRVYDNAKAHKIELITPKLDDFRTNEIAKRYTNNLDFWIKNWVASEDFNNVTIPKMREVVGRMAIEGKSVKDIEEYLLSSFTKCQRHAKFLARNESAIATTSYLRAKYIQEGFTHFKWHTNYDGRERELHHELGLSVNNKYGIDGKNIYRFDNPPVIDERTGQRGLPAETYNCRCSFSPVATKEFWENRKKLFKARNSLINKIKDFIKC